VRSLPRFKVLKLDDLSIGSRKIVELNGYEVVLLRTQESVYALSNICPHLGGALGEGTWVGKIITCPLHYWAFDISTGRSVNQPSNSVETYPVRVEAGWVFLDLPEEDLEE